MQARSLGYPLMALGATAAVLAACSSASGGAGIRRAPSRTATVLRIAAPPDSVIQRAWEVIRTDGILARWFQRTADDTTNTARMESDWIYVPNVVQSATFGHLSEPEKWVKMLFWAVPEHGGTLLYIEALFNPTTMPTEPVRWGAMRPVPRAHPAWQYVEVMANNLLRRLRKPTGENG